MHPPDFQKALSLQQEKKYDEAMAVYKSLMQGKADQSLDLTPEQIADISYNAALASFGQQNYLQSYVFNQKALLLRPSHPQAQALSDKIKTHFQVKAIPHEITLIENLNKAGLEVIPLEILWLSGTMLLALFLKNILSFYLRRKKELEDNKQLSHFSLKNYLGLFLGMSLFLLAAIKIWDHQIPKALISREQAALRTAASDTAATVSELPGGSLVHILRQLTHQDVSYFQVKYPGSVSGWVKEADLEIIDRSNLPKD